LAASLERNANPEKPWWFSFLPVRLQRQDEELRISGTTIVRRLESRTLVVLAAVPKSANSTVIDCAVFGSKPPKPAELEALKMGISSEIDQLVVKSRDLRDQVSASYFVTVHQAQIDKHLETHLDAERKMGVEIHPAARNQNFTLEGKADDDCKNPVSPSLPRISNCVVLVCKELGEGGESVCSANAKGLLDW
jgi:hypothetical protein